MSYVTAITTAVFTFPIIALLFTMPFIIAQYHKYGSVHKLRVLIIYSFILYLMTAFFLVILPLPSFEEVRNLTTPIANLVPFSFVTDFIKETPLVITSPGTYLSAVMHPSFYVVIFNVFLTVPFGIYLRYYYKCSFKKTVLLTFLLSLFFEVTQVTGLYFIYPRAYRLFDFDDLMLNTLGGMLGYAVSGLLTRFLPSRQKIDEEAIKTGTKVSGLRRVTTFFIDFTLCLTLALSLNVFIKNNYVVPAVFLMYFVLFPCLFNGKTVGSGFLRWRLFSERFLALKILFRFIFLYAYYYKIPFLMITLPFKINADGIGGTFAFLFYLMIVFAFLIYYVVNLILLLKNGRAFYDKIIGITYQSTIKVPEDNDVNN